MSKSGKLIDIGLDAALEHLVGRPGLSYLRLHGEGVELRFVHVGRGQLFVMDSARKVKHRLGERLVRYGFLDREILVTMLRKLEDDGTVLDFSGHISPQLLETVLMGQTQDSLDRLTLFPMLDYEFGEQTAVYRGGKIKISAVRKRIQWAESHRDIFLKWRRRLETGTAYMDPRARGRSSVHAGIDFAINAQLGWDGFQAKLREPLFNIAARLEMLEADGSLSFFEKEKAPIPHIQKSRWVWCRGILSLLVLCGLLWFTPIGFDKTVRDVYTPTMALLDTGARVYTARTVAQVAEVFNERNGHYPTPQQLRNLMTESHADRLDELQYVGLPDDFILGLRDDGDEVRRNAKD